MPPNHNAKPNLVYIMADQLRYQSCGYAGDTRAHTPNIDRLASESISFQNAISGSPMCAPYRASLLTGKYTSSTGMVINELRMNPGHRCFAHVLTDAGYDTPYIGKWHLWANQLGNHTDVKNAFTPPGPHRLGFDGYWATYNFWHQFYEAFYYEDTPDRHEVDGYEPDVQTDMAIRWLKEQRTEKPFALFVSYGTPHDPWVAGNVPPEYYELFRNVEFPHPPNYRNENHPYADNWGRFKEGERERLEEWQRVYYAMVANLDWNVGRLHDALKESGQLENTIFVFTSDHGEMFGAQGRRAKNIFYEEAIRIPFLLTWPGHTQAGATTDVCFNTPDIMPTLLALMGLPVPDEVEGMDLSHCALLQAGPEPEAAFMQGMGCTAAWQDGHEWRGLRDKEFTYAVMKKDGTEYLFNNAKDPYQTTNLVGHPNYTDILARFRNILTQRMAVLNDTFETCTWYRDHWTEDRVILRTATLNPADRKGVY